MRFQGPAAFSWNRFLDDKSKRGDFRLPRGKDDVGDVAKMLSGFFFLGLPMDDNVDERRLSSCGREGCGVTFSFELCGGDEEKLVLVSELETIIEEMFSYLLLTYCWIQGEKHLIPPLRPHSASGPRPFDEPFNELFCKHCKAWVNQ